MSDVIQRRRSVRQFGERAVTDAEMASLMEAASLAPSALNTQPWKFLAITRPALKAEIRRIYVAATRKLLFFQAHPWIPKLVGKTVRGVYAQDTGFLETATLIVGVYEAATPYARESTCFALQNLMLRAAELNLGTCCLARPMSLGSTRSALKKALGIGKGDELLFLIAVGESVKPLETLAVPKRKAVADILQRID